MYHSPLAGPEYTPQWMNMPSLASCSHWIFSSDCCSTPRSDLGIRSGRSGSGWGEEAAACAGVASVGETAAATVMAAMPASTLRRLIGSDKDLS